MNLFKELSLRFKHLVLLVICSSLISIPFFPFFFLYTSLPDHIHRIQTAERQLNLIEWINACTQANAGIKAQEARYLFNHSLQVLKEGGAIAGFENTFMLAATNDEAEIALIKKITKTFADLNQHVENSHQKDSLQEQFLLLNSLKEQTYALLAYYQQVQEHFQQLTTIIIILVVACLAGMLFLHWQLFNLYILRPTMQLQKAAQLAASGNFSCLTNYRAGDEIGKTAEAIDKIIESQLSISAFAASMGEGDFKNNLTLKESGKLAMSLLTLQAKLAKVAGEDKKRNWAIEGLAKFSEILRTNNDNLQQLSQGLLIELVNYLHANQGTLFVVHDENAENIYAEAMATYAWDRKRFTEKQFSYGEGLVGQVLREGDTIYLTDIPQQYVTITSGLGKANPTSLLLVPLKIEGQIHGVLELASFTNYDTHEISFVEKLSESIASTLASTKSAYKTKQLLEEARVLNEQMRSQEEEMRQNLEELNSTQEEMQRKEIELTGIFSSINHTLATAEYDLNGTLLTANTLFCQLLQFSLEEIKGKPHVFFIETTYAPREDEHPFWQDLQAGLSKSVDLNICTKQGESVWLHASYTPVLTKQGTPYKVIQLAQDITAKKQTELASKRHAEELQAQGELLKAYTQELEVLKGSLSEKLEEAKVEMKLQIQDLQTEKTKNLAILEGCVDGVISFNHQGKVEFFNQAAQEIWAVSKTEVTGQPISLLIPLSIITSEKDATHVIFTKEGRSKEINTRTEVNVISANGEDISLLLTLSKAKVGAEYTYTLFIQKISVDLF